MFLGFSSISESPMSTLPTKVGFVIRGRSNQVISVSSLSQAEIRLVANSIISIMASSVGYGTMTTSKPPRKKIYATVDSRAFVHARVNRKKIFVDR